MNSCSTLKEFKKRIREEELRAGEKNFHGRRFVNWMVQGGCKRRHKTGLYGGYTKRARLHGGMESDDDTDADADTDDTILPPTQNPEPGTEQWYQLKAQNKVRGTLTPLSEYFTR